ncbi:sensor histidine kinase KdpD [Flavobacterium sp. ASW18X]|uniref:sensor histidine kinase n=1 Tax=Flavobacterium sp. ASW18X TaxID=2572595 RepID=UPI0010ADD128|nr:HAMP domain-containing sensor histidine kinase [Flavobacterium sp. ASW18X]TKD56564.1 HAMP domain-containing histidine kinase [Flavobacterium sp. ASW18X]
MKQQRRNIFLLIFIISIFGLAFVQYQYLRIGLNLAKVQFGQKVEKAKTDILADLSTENQLTYLLSSAFKKDTTFFKMSPDSIVDASRYFLNDFLKEKLQSNGVDATYSYTLYSKDSTLVLKAPTSLPDKTNRTNYPIYLEGYLTKEANQGLILELEFQNLNNYYLKQLSGLTLPSILFLLGILSTVVWVLRTYYWQRKVITTTDTFINNLTHELKTPTFSIKLASKMLEEHVEAKGTPFLAIIKQQSHRLANHIDNVLELASLERKRAILRLSIFNFKPNLEAVCQEFEQLASVENVKFKYTIEGDSFLINGEAFHLENVINNVLDNAKKYAESPRIELTAKKVNNTLQIAIKDNGRGIAREEKQKVFQKYFRTTNGDLHGAKGYGLGLYYVATIVKKHKGKIKMESELGKGTKIVITLPLQ